jgi:hypothetical protein
MRTHLNPSYPNGYNTAPKKKCRGLPQFKKIDYLVLRPQPADLTPFKKQVVVRIRHQMSVILGNIGEIVALDYLESKEYKVCKIADHAMTISLYDLKAENRLEMQQPSLGRVSSREYRIPILDLHARWKSMDGEVARFCKHMQPFLAKKLWECYCSYRFQHHL